MEEGVGTEQQREQHGTRAARATRCARRRPPPACRPRCPSHQSQGQMNVFSSACTMSRAVWCVHSITTPPENRRRPGAERVRDTPTDPPLAINSGMRPAQRRRPRSPQSRRVDAATPPRSTTSASASIGSVSTADLRADPDRQAGEQRRRPMQPPRRRLRPPSAPAPTSPPRIRACRSADGAR